MNKRKQQQAILPAAKKQKLMHAPQGFWNIDNDSLENIFLFVGTRSENKWHLVECCRVSKQFYHVIWKSNALWKNYTAENPYDGYREWDSLPIPMLERIAPHSTELDYNERFCKLRVAQFAPILLPYITIMYCIIQTSETMAVLAHYISKLLVLRISFGRKEQFFDLATICPKLEILEISESKISVSAPLTLREVIVGFEASVSIFNIDKCNFLTKFAVTDYLSTLSNETWLAISTLPSLTFLNVHAYIGDWASLFANSPCSLTHLTSTAINDNIFLKLVSTNLLELCTLDAMDINFWNRVCTTYTNLVSLSIGDEFYSYEEDLVEIHSLKNLRNLLQLTIHLPVPFSFLHDIVVLPKIQELHMSCVKAQGDSSIPPIVCYSLRKLGIGGATDDLSSICSCFPNIEFLRVYLRPKIEAQSLLQACLPLKKLHTIEAVCTKQAPKLILPLNSTIKTVKCYDATDLIQAYCPNTQTSSEWLSSIHLLALLLLNRIAFSSEDERGKCVAATLNKVQSVLPVLEELQNFVQQIMTSL